MPYAESQESSHHIQINPEEMPMMMLPDMSRMTGVVRSLKRQTVNPPPAIVEIRMPVRAVTQEEVWNRTHVDTNPSSGVSVDDLERYVKAHPDDHEARFNYMVAAGIISGVAGLCALLRPIQKGVEWLDKHPKIRAAASTAMALVLAACGVAEGVPPPQAVEPTPVQPGATATEVSNQPNPLPTASPTVAEAQTEPAAEATKTTAPVETPTPVRPEYQPNSGGPYSEAQWKLISEGAFADQENDLNNYVENYWCKALNAPFLCGSQDLVYKYLFDLKDPNSAVVVLEAMGEPYNGQIFYFPIKDGKFMKVPPGRPVGEYSIPPGSGPLPLSGGTEGLGLANVDGQLVRVDALGNVAEVINANGQWEKVSPHVAALRETQGDKTENWFTWREDLNRWQVQLVYPGKESIHNETIDMVDGNGNVVGKAHQWFEATFLIGNEDRSLIIPSIWENSQTGKCWYWVGPLNCGGSNMQWLLEDGHAITGNPNSVNLVPGQVITFYIRNSMLTGVPEANDDPWADNVDDVSYFYEGKQGALNALFTKGDNSIRMLLTERVTRLCLTASDTQKYPLECQQEPPKIVPGY